MNPIYPPTIGPAAALRARVIRSLGVRQTGVSASEPELGAGEDAVSLGVVRAGDGTGAVLPRGPGWVAPQAAIATIEMSAATKPKAWLYVTIIS
jgi:hypothetical protein